MWRVFPGNFPGNALSYVHNTLPPEELLAMQMLDRIYNDRNIPMTQTLLLRGASTYLQIQHYILAARSKLEHALVWLLLYKTMSYIRLLWHHWKLGGVRELEILTIGSGFVPQVVSWSDCTCSFVVGWLCLAGIGQSSFSKYFPVLKASTFNS